jgi:hypothetical protein
MAKYKNLAVDPQLHARVRALANANHRTLRAQLEVIIDAFEGWQIQSATTLPHPADAQAVPVVTVAKYDGEVTK